MSATAAPRVLVCGDVINDILVETVGPLADGEDNPAAIRTRPGGSAANQAAWMGSLGLDVVFAGRAGASDVGLHRRELARFGVRPHIAADACVATGSIVVLVGSDGERTMITDRGANVRLQPADVPAALLDGAALLHLTGYSFFAPAPREVALGLIAEARRRGLPFTVDPGSAVFLEQAGRAAFLNWTQGAAICFPNRDEAAVLTATPPNTAPATEPSTAPRTEPGLAPSAAHRVASCAAPGAAVSQATGIAPSAAACSIHNTSAAPGPCTDPLAMAAELTRHYGAVALKLGHQGVVLAVAGDPPVAVPAVAATVRDTTGAGDAFCAGYLAAWLGGATPPDAAAAGIQAASLAVSRLGGRPA